MPSLKMTLWRLRWDMLALLVLVLGVLALYGVGHGRYGLFDVDEAIFTEASREMVADGTWSMPSYNGEPRYHKPPLIYWLQAAGMEKLGPDSLWAARLPSAVSSVLTVLGLFGGILWLTGRLRWALWSAAILALSLGFMVIGRAATADGILNLVVLLNALAVVRLLYGPRWPWGKLTVGLLAGLGFLAKGPIAWLVPGVIGLAVILARMNLAPDWREALNKVWKRADPVQLGLVALAVILPWGYWLVIQRGWGFFYEFFVVHNFQRFGGGLTNTQSDSPVYYLLVVLVGMFPLVWLLPAAMVWVKNDWRQRLGKLDVAEALPVIGLIWGLGVVVFFSFSATKLAHYIVPAYAGFAIALGAMLERYPRTKLPTWPRWGLLGMGMLGAAVVGFLGWMLMGLQLVRPRGWVGYGLEWMKIEWPPHDVLLRDVLMQPVSVPWAGFALAGLLMAVAAGLAWWALSPQVSRLREWRLWLASALMAWGLALFMVNWVVVPTVWQYTQAPLAELARRIAWAPPGIRLIHLGLHKPSVLYLSQRPFLKLEKALQVPLSLGIGQRALVLLEQADVPELQREFAISKGTVTPQECVGGYCVVLVDRVQD